MIGGRNGFRLTYAALLCLTLTVCGLEPLHHAFDLTRSAQTGARPTGIPVEAAQGYPCDVCPSQRSWGVTYAPAAAVRAPESGERATSVFDPEVPEPVPIS